MSLTVLLQGRIRALWVRVLPAGARMIHGFFWCYLSNIFWTPKQAHRHHPFFLQFLNKLFLSSVNGFIPAILAGLFQPLPKIDIEITFYKNNFLFKCREWRVIWLINWYSLFLHCFWIPKTFWDVVYWRSLDLTHKLS